MTILAAGTQTASYWIGYAMAPIIVLVVILAVVQNSKKKKNLNTDDPAPK